MPKMCIHGSPKGEKGGKKGDAGFRAPFPLWERGWGESLLSFASQPVSWVQFDDCDD